MQKYYKISSSDDVRVSAIRNLLVTGSVLSVAVLVRDIAQQAHSTSVGLFLAVAAAAALYKFRTKIGIDRSIKIVSLLLTIVGFYFLQKLGLLSAAFIGLMYNTGFIGLLKNKNEQYFFLVLALLPIWGYVVYIFLGYPAPVPDNLEQFASLGSSWFVKASTATFFSVLLLFTISSLVARLIGERENYRHSFFNSMTQLSLLRDQETGEHIERCSEFSGILLQECKRCNFDVSTEINAETMCEAVKLHDVGKVALSDTVLQKPGKLTDGEFERVKRHTTVGSEIIIAVARANKIENDLVVTTAADIALSHHENWDGSGYPQSIAGRGISLASRIMAIVDVYDALRSERPYKKAFSHSKTLEIMTEMRGQKFDPELFDIFMGVADRFETTYEKLKSPIA